MMRVTRGEVEEAYAAYKANPAHRKVFRDTCALWQKQTGKVWTPNRKSISGLTLK